jgi:GNAT superfamily N-acetyltransferase
VNDPDVARALFDAAGAWVKAKGMDTLRGPMSPSINDECGLLVDGFDTPPTLMMPHNPRYYVQLTEGAGFRKAMDLLCYQPARPAPPERVARAADVLAKRKGITLRPFNMKRFKEEVELIKKLYNDAWEKNWGFVAMTDAEIDHLAKQLKPVVIPDLIVFAEKDGQTVGFAVALPDMNVALKKNPSGRLFPGIISILWAARKINRARILLLGTIPEYRGSGVDAMLYHWIWTKANAHGIFWGEGGWVLENNPAMKNGMIRLGFAAYKTYRLYDRPPKRAAIGVLSARSALQTGARSGAAQGCEKEVRDYPAWQRRRGPLQCPFVIHCRADWSGKVHSCRNRALARSTIFTPSFTTRRLAGWSGDGSPGRFRT